MGNLDRIKGGMIELRGRITNGIPKGAFLKLFGKIPFEKIENSQANFLHLKRKVLNING